MAQGVRLLMCIRIMLGSNLSCDTGCPELRFFMLLVSLSKKLSFIDQLITPQQLSFISFPIHDFLSSNHDLIQREVMLVRRLRKAVIPRHEVSRKYTASWVFKAHDTLKRWSTPIPLTTDITTWIGSTFSRALMSMRSRGPLWLDAHGIHIRWICDTLLILGTWNSRTGAAARKNKTPCP
jgi:hypothetical protein